MFDDLIARRASCMQCVMRIRLWTILTMIGWYDEKRTMEPQRLVGAQRVKLPRRLQHASVLADGMLEDMKCMCSLIRADNSPSLEIS